MRRDTLEIRPTGNPRGKTPPHAAADDQIANFDLFFPQQIVDAAGVAICAVDPAKHSPPTGPLNHHVDCTFGVDSEDHVGVGPEDPRDAANDAISGHHWQTFCHHTSTAIDAQPQDPNER